MTRDMAGLGGKGRKGSESPRTNAAMAALAADVDVRTERAAGVLLRRQRRDTWRRLAGWIKGRVWTGLNGAGLSFSFFLFTRTPVQKIIIIYFTFKRVCIPRDIFFLFSSFFSVYLNQALLPPCVGLPFEKSSCSEALWAYPLHRLNILWASED